MKVTIDVDDEEIRRLLAPLLRPPEPVDDPSAGMPRLLRAVHVARQLGISRSKVFELIANGSIRTVMIGRSRRVPVTALRELMAAEAGDGRAE